MSVTEDIYLMPTIPNLGSQMASLYMHMGQIAPDTECLEQPQDHCDNHNNVQKRLDLAVHGNVGVDKPKNDTYDNQGDNDGNK